MDRYSRNKKLISQEEQDILLGKKVCVMGCGGLGGYVIEMLARVGIGELALVDCDFFDSTNLNRQLLSSEENLGESKVGAAIERVQSINSEIRVKGIIKRIDKDNMGEIISSYDLVIDALDSIPLKVELEKACSEAGITMIHGAIGGWIAQVAVCRPGDSLLEVLYGDIEEGVEKDMGNPSFTPALAASIQVSEALKVLLTKGEPLRGEILYIDLSTNTFSTLQLNK